MLGAAAGPWRRVGTPLALALALVLTAGLAGCDWSQLQFRVDRRLHILAPRSDARLHLPVTLRWTMRDFTVHPPDGHAQGRDTGYFVVFLDQAPVRPGQTLAAKVSGQPQCRADPAGCLTPEQLTGLQIYPTTRTSLTLTEVAPLAGSTSGEQQHTAVIVLMDTAGRRIGEASWFVDFLLPVQGP